MRNLTRAELFLISGGDNTLTSIHVYPDPGGGTPPGIGGGGGAGGGILGSPTTSGTHNVYDRDYTSKVANENNPGNLVANSWTAAHGSDGSTGAFANFATEQDGRQALGDLLDANYYSSTPTSLSHDGYNGGSAAAQNIESNNINSYMASHGYTNAQNDQINSMNNQEFNVMLDAITNAEGGTNM
ncbi:hypothetical protein GCM10009552_28590 [Rothia nasimurium]|uniref:Uncharacterized protein n=1 Tax=Luteibacter anthropi TaxID=564369 RepID=A0A7X5UAK6_9GAMM|nr:hypothetical protein [Luteibacter anthropi]NII06943.1 hypothetical protein [Luteibacter anthropi]